MPHTKNTRFGVSDFMKKRKEARQKAVEECRVLKAELYRNNRKIDRLQTKVSDSRIALADITNGIPNNQLQLGNTDTSARTRPPTILVDGKSNMPPRTAAKRRHETLTHASAIHGGSKNNPDPAFDGMFDTLAKRCKVGKMKDYVLGQKTLKEKVASATFKKNVKAFESSAENAKRSIAVFYSSGVMGKRKYKSVRISLSMKTNETTKGRSAITVMPKCPIPKLLPYDKLVKEIDQIDIGNVYRFDEEFQGAIRDELTQGCFRKLVEYLPRLAKFYLRKDRKEALQWFGKTEGTFLIAVGGDGCPFGKNESACSFLLSFMNVGKRVASSNDNFIIFGGNCEETSLVVRKYCQFLCKEICEIENKVFEIEGLHVTFKCAELPNDMKMMAMLGGELSNSAKYFSSFANVSKDNCTDLKGTFATDRTSLWHPWKYEDRIKIVNEVEKFKKTLTEKQLKEKQFRSKVTEFIARKKRRQQFVPLIGKLIDHAHVEPLHVKNNAWQYFFKEVLKEALAKSNIADSCKKFSEIPNDSIISRVVTALQFEVKAKCLARKVKNWFDETQGKGKDLQYRFTGKDSRLLCHNFMRLIRWLSGENDSEHQRTTLLVLAYLGLRLRDCVSLFSRFEISVEQLTQLSVAACEYYRVNALFLSSSVNPTVWTIGHIIPAHTKDVHEKYGQGLGIVTMEGREAKHIALKKLSENTFFHRRWYEIFKHEFVMLVWLPEQGFDLSTYKHNGIYIPNRVFSDTRFCYCNLEKTDASDEKCSFCGDPIMALIQQSVEQGKVLPRIAHQVSLVP